MSHHPKVDVATLQQSLEQLFAPWVCELDLRVVAAGDGEVLLVLPVTPRHLHSGGVLCGQTMMAACDTAMVPAVTTKLGGFRPMTTVQLQTSFLRPIPGDAGSVRLKAQVLRMGRTIVFGEIDLLNAKGERAAHTTTTYALL